MKIIRSSKRFQREMEKQRLQGRRIGFVPTMGALHEGHLSLVRRAKRENDRVAVSIFVNPLQFGPKEDFKKYPRNETRDGKLLKTAGADYLFLPSPRDFYPENFQTSVEIGKVSEGLCGGFRPGHFRGVATVVTKLFNLAKPHTAYFGAKDFQQAAVIRRLAEDLNFDVEIKVMPTVRDHDGLALSSRNAYLSKDGRRQALSIPEALRWARSEVRKGNRNLKNLRRHIRSRLRRSLHKIDYVEFRDPVTLKPVERLKHKGVILLIAGWVGKTRLIDNAIMHAS